ncbi:aldehyde ferredoxin oxidoreductase N-terminal domain-containing protein, partial [Thermosulfuriphilus sp.]
MVPHDSLERVLYVDLSRRSFSIESRPELFENFLGGAGVASQLLLEECPEGVDPLSAEAPVIMAIGPLCGHFPMASKTAAFFKSPHTGNLGETHAGGRSAISLRMAGFGALVIKGKSDFPVILEINSHRVSFLDAR